MHAIICAATELQSRMLHCSTRRCRGHRAPRRCRARAPHVAQDKKHPLHYAAEASASLEVMTLLLEADSNAAAAADKARAAARPLHVPPARCHETHCGAVVVSLAPFCRCARPPRSALTLSRACAAPRTGRTVATAHCR